MKGRIFTPLKEGDIDRLFPSVRRPARMLNYAITSVRQTAEWGMGSVEKVYHRLPLPCALKEDVCCCLTCSACQTTEFVRRGSARSVIHSLVSNSILWFHLYRIEMHVAFYLRVNRAHVDTCPLHVYMYLLLMKLCTFGSALTSIIFCKGNYENSRHSLRALRRRWSCAT